MVIAGDVDLSSGEAVVAKTETAAAASRRESTALNESLDSRGCRANQPGKGDIQVFAILQRLLGENLNVPFS